MGLGHEANGYSTAFSSAGSRLATNPVPEGAPRPFGSPRGPCALLLAESAARLHILALQRCAVDLVEDSLAVWMLESQVGLRKLTLEVAMKSRQSFAIVIPLVIALWAVPTSAQTLNVSVEGQGKVTGTGIDCPSDCTENFLPTSIPVPGRPSRPGLMIVLTAVPAAGYQLSRWTGSCQEGLESPTCTVAMSGGATVSATFVAAPRAQLNIVFIGSRPDAQETRVFLQPYPGPIVSTSAGFENVCEFRLNPSGCTMSSAQAGSWTAIVGSQHFVGWGGACSGMGELRSGGGAYTCTTSISPGEVKTISASFAAVGISAVGTGPGKIVVSPPDGFVSAGTAVTFRAEPNAGASFVEWGGACSGSVPVCTVTAESNNIAVSAQFGDFSVGVAGSGSVQMVSQAGASGLSITLVAEPAAGHVFAGWVGGCSGTSLTCTPASGAKVTAIFHPAP
jgi:hypothetical protein